MCVFLQLQGVCFVCIWPPPFQGVRFGCIWPPRARAVCCLPLGQASSLPTHGHSHSIRLAPSSGRNARCCRSPHRRLRPRAWTRPPPLAPSPFLIVAPAAAAAAAAAPAPAPALTLAHVSALAAAVATAPAPAPAGAGG